MKFFSTSQIRELDKFTIENEPIASIDLMERAANALYEKYLSTFSYLKPVCILAGPGNNGGDALALARMLLLTSLDVKVILLHTGKVSADCETNRLRLLEKFPDSLIELNNEFIAPEITNDTIIIDGLFGSGLTRSLSGIFADAVKWMNESGCKVMSIDIPSGLQGEENIPLTPKGENNNPIVRADYTFSLQFPKLAFLLPENEEFVGQWEVVDIGIHPQAIAQTETSFATIEVEDVQSVLKKRSKFSHKGTFGHALIISGSKGMAGASVLSARAALRSGVGLVTIHGPECNRLIVQTAIPEAIFQSDASNDFISEVDNIENYSAIAIGPGIGTVKETALMLENMTKGLEKPCIFDADALNIIGQHNHLLQLIPHNSIFTPHPKEFERLFGPCSSSYERMLKAQKMSQQLKIIIVLKGTHTLISTPDGKLHFNTTGNAGMATAGSGDVLTGILAGLLAQGYSPEDTAKIGVFIHGYAGDLALKAESEESLIAGDIICHLGEAFQSIKVDKKLSNR